jgi:hypothetical protein
MITLELIEFLEREEKKNAQREVTTSRLLAVGWKKEDIEAGFEKMLANKARLHGEGNTSAPVLNTNTQAQSAGPVESNASIVVVAEKKEEPKLEIEGKPMTSESIIQDQPIHEKAKEFVQNFSFKPETVNQAIVLSPVTEIKTEEINQKEVKTEEVKKEVDTENKTEEVKQEVKKEEPEIKIEPVVVEKPVETISPIQNIIPNVKPVEATSESIVNTIISEKPKRLIPDVVISPLVSKEKEPEAVISGTVLEPEIPSIFLDPMPKLVYQAEPKKIVSTAGVDPYRELPTTEDPQKNSFSPSAPVGMPKVWPSANDSAVTENNDLIPHLTKKTAESFIPQNSSAVSTVKPLISSGAPVLNTNAFKLASYEPVSTGVGTSSVSNPAITASFPKEMMKNNFQSSGSSGVPKFLIWILLIIFLGVIGFGAWFAVSNNLINIPGISFAKNEQGVAPLEEMSDGPVLEDESDIYADSIFDEELDFGLGSNQLDTLNVSSPVLPETLNVSDTNPQSRLNELKGKDGMIQNYIVNLLSLHIYKKFALGYSKGLKPNNGSCSTPSVGSVFYSSPNDAPEESVSNYLNPLLDLNGGKGYCFSDSKAWAMSFPLASDSSTYLCMDSSNRMINTKNILTGTICR